MKTILSLAGGGMRGLIGATVLAHLEKRLGSPLHAFFDLVAGTSTGGILASLVTRGLPADSYASFYTERGARIFKKGLMDYGWLGPKFDVRKLNKELVELLGTTTLRDAKAELLIASYDKLSRSAFFFKSYDEYTADMRMSDAATATAAAPAYFNHWDAAYNGRRFEFIDGGLFCNVPALASYCDTLHDHAGEPCQIIQIGTGYPDVSKKHHLPNGGLISWAPKALEVAMDGEADTVDYFCRRLLGDRYISLDIQMDRDVAMDDVSPRTLAYLAELGERLAQTEEFEKAVEVLNV